MKQDFTPQSATIGVEFSELILENIDIDNPNVVVKVHLWDTCLLLT